MTPSDTQHRAEPPGRFKWALRAVSLTCLALTACVVISSRSPEAQSGPPPVASLPLPVTASGPLLELVRAPDSNVELHGTTTIGPWTSRSTDIHGRIILDADETGLEALFDRIEAAAPSEPGPLPPPALLVRSPPVASISVPVISLHGESSGMDRDMHNALKAAQHPDIDYAFQQLSGTTVQRGPAGRAELNLRVLGTLSMAGVNRPVAMDVIVRRDTRGHFLAHARASLLMSDFGVTPPVAAFGLIHAGDRVVVDFDLDLILTTLRRAPQ